MYKISFYVPVSHVEAVKGAMFKAGAGKIGNYCCAAWQVLGEGQFIPLEGSHPTIGTQFRLETVKEYKVEMMVTDDCIQDVVEALRAAHPYEEPAFHVSRSEDF